jgi:hypothetical protein
MGTPITAREAARENANGGPAENAARTDELLKAAFLHRPARLGNGQAIRQSDRDSNLERRFNPDPGFGNNENRERCESR